jgi:hypothetical protein
MSTLLPVEYLTGSEFHPCSAKFPFAITGVCEKIRSRLNSGNASYRAVQHLLSSRLLSRNVKIKIYKTTVLPVVLYGCETWSLTLREDIDWGCLRTGCKGEYLDLRGMKWQVVGVNSIMRSCMVCTLHPVLLGWSGQGWWDGRGMWRAWGRWGVHKTFWLVSLTGEDHWEDRRRWEDNIGMDLRETGFGDADWIHLAQDRDRWRALVNTVMDLRVP